MKNKKGLLGIVSLGILLILAFVFIAFFIFSQTFKFTIIGVALLVLSFVVLLGVKIKEEKTKIIIFIVLLGAGMFFIFGSGMLQSFVMDRYVEVPFFATIECQRGITSSFQYNLPSDGEWFYKGRNLPENADSYSLQVTTPDYGIISVGKRLVYQICNSKSFCSNEKIVTLNRRGDMVNIGTVDADKFVWIQHQTAGFTGWDDQSGAYLTVTYQPFILIRDDPLRGGRQQVANVIGCNVPTSDVSWTKRITDFSGTTGIDEFSGDNKLEPGEIINYISGDILAVMEGGLQSGGWCIYENGQANIYEIEQITYGSNNNINRVNLDNRIKIEDCCDGEVYPNNAICQGGEFIPIDDAECTRRSDCGTLEYFKTSANTIGRYGCIDGSCEIVDERLVECTSDQQCLTNQFCSRNTFTCILSSEQGGEGDETQDTCETNADCLNGLECIEGVCTLEDDDTCAWFEQSYTRIEKDYGALYWRAYTPFFDPIETEVSGCKTADWINLLAIIIIIGGISGFAIYSVTKKKK